MEAARYDALRAGDGRCELCGRSKHHGAVLNVDHVRNRRNFPRLVLDPRNLQVPDGACNLGKGNRHANDWRHPLHPYQP